MAASKGRHAGKRTTRGHQVKLDHSRYKSKEREARSHKNPKSRSKKPESKAHREKRLEKKRLAERARRERLKQDTDAREKERLRWHQRKAEGKVKLVSQLQPREKSWRRRQQRKWKQEQRKREQECNREEQECNREEEKTPSSHQASVGRLKVRRDKAACYKTVKKQKEQIDSLTKTVGKWKQRFHRLRQSVTTKKNVTSPRTTVRKFLRGEQVSGKVKKRLLFGEVVNVQLKSSYNRTRSYKVKQIFGRMCNGEITRKYHFRKYFKKTIIPYEPTKKVIKESKTLGPLDYARKQKNREFVTKVVTEFYNNNSTIDPGKKETVTRKGVTASKQYLQGSLKELYAKFCETVSAFKVSYTTFCRMKPFYCKAPVERNRDTCACKFCDNTELLIKALKTKKVLGFSTSEEARRSIFCDMKTEKCLNRSCDSCKAKEIVFDRDIGGDICYQQWISEKERRTDSKGKEILVKVTKKVFFKAMVKQVIEKFQSHFSMYVAHRYRVDHQFLILKELKENLKDNEAILHIHFSENYSCKYQKEVQSLHFGGSRQNFTLLTGMFYEKNYSEGFCTLSECNDHGPAAITAHLIEAMSYFLSGRPHIDTVHFVSDGPTTQYRSKNMFYSMSQILPVYFKMLKFFTYNFSEAGHGKGAPDGIGGFLKRTLDDAVRYGTDTQVEESMLISMPHGYPCRCMDNWAWIYAWISMLISMVLGYPC